MRRFDANHRKTIRIQLDENLTAHSVLSILHECLNITHHWIVHLSFMHPIAVKSCQLVFPTQLPLSKRMLFKCMMSFYNDNGCSCLKTNAALDANNCVADVNVTTDAIRLGDCLQLLNDFYRPDTAAVQCHGFAVFKFKRNTLRLG